MTRHVGNHNVHDIESNYMTTGFDDHIISFLTWGSRCRLMSFKSDPQGLGHIYNYPEHSKNEHCKYLFRVCYIIYINNKG